MLLAEGRGGGETKRTCRRRTELRAPRRPRGWPAATLSKACVGFHGRRSGGLVMSYSVTQYNIQ